MAVKRKRSIVPKLNSEAMVKIEKIIEHRPNPAANELRMSKRTLDIFEYKTDLGLEWCNLPSLIWGK